MRLKWTMVVVMATALAGMHCGCSDQAGSGLDKATETATKGMEQAEAKLETSWDQFAEYTVDKKQDFAASVKNASVAIQDQANTLAKGSENVATDAVQGVKDAAAALDKELDKVEEATEDEWDEVKKGVEEAWDKLEEAYQNLKGKVA